MNIWRLIGVAAIVVLPASPASAQQVKSVDGLVINFGLMSAEKAIHADGHRDAHPGRFPSGSQHVLVTLANGTTGLRIGDADVVVEVIDPQGKTEKKPMLHTSAAGMADYSELFVFGWTGTYRVRVNVTQGKGGKGGKPANTTFTVHHQL
jgi:hypothetical protein